MVAITPVAKHNFLGLWCIASMRTEELSAKFHNSLISAFEKAAVEKFDLGPFFFAAHASNSCQKVVVIKFVADALACSMLFTIAFALEIKQR